MQLAAPKMHVLVFCNHAYTLSFTCRVAISNLHVSIPLDYLHHKVCSVCSAKVSHSVIGFTCFLYFLVFPCPVFKILHRSDEHGIQWTHLP